MDSGYQSTGRSSRLPVVITSGNGATYSSGCRHEIRNRRDHQLSWSSLNYDRTHIWRPELLLREEPLNRHWPKEESNRHAARPPWFHKALTPMGWSEVPASVQSVWSQ